MKLTLCLATVLALNLGFVAAYAQFERHPELRDAARDLESAKRHLKEAHARPPREFGGHREKAIAAIDGALEEIRASARVADGL